MPRVNSSILARLVNRNFVGEATGAQLAVLEDALNTEAGRDSLVQHVLHQVEARLRYKEQAGHNVATYVNIPVRKEYWKKDKKEKGNAN